jgi:hypothetical protein
MMRFCYTEVAFKDTSWARLDRVDFNRQLFQYRQLNSYFLCFLNLYLFATTYLVSLVNTLYISSFGVKRDFCMTLQLCSLTSVKTHFSLPLKLLQGKVMIKIIKVGLERLSLLKLRRAQRFG